VRRIEVRDFPATDIPNMTMYIENNYKKIFNSSVIRWINDEVNNLPFDDYIKNVCKGCLMRSCLISQQKKFGMWDNQVILLDPSEGCVK